MFNPTMVNVTGSEKTHLRNILYFKKYSLMPNCRDAKFTAQVE